jgi:TrmH family RNA methyltransferase
MARHGEDILKNAKVFHELERAIEPYEVKIATTGKTRNFVTIRPEEIPKYDSMCIVFGRESSGLTNEEIKMCDLVVRIPASQEYPVLNLSHAVAIILYTLFEKGEVKSPDIRSIKFWLDKISEEINMKERFEILKDVITRGLPRKNEANAISGVLREIYSRIKK